MTKGSTNKGGIIGWGIAPVFLKDAMAPKVIKPSSRIKGIQGKG
jgi:hypothetical protein